MNESGEQGRWPRDDVAERLLNGEDVDDSDPRTAELAGLLAAARTLAPGRPQDESAALEAFRARYGAAPGAAAAAVPAHHGRRWRAAPTSRSARMLLGGVVAAFTLSGVAIAAQGGALPHPFRSGRTTHEPSAPASSTPPGGTGTPSAADGRGAGSTPPPARPGAPHATGAVSPSAGAPGTQGTKGLCNAYLTAQRDGRTPGQGLQDRLARAAGGAAGIDAYCAALTASPVPGHGRKSASPHVTPPESAHPSAPAGTPDPVTSAAPNAVRHK